MGFWEPLFFWIFAIGAVCASSAVVLMRNPLYSAMALILNFFFFAGLYGLLSAHFMALTQILVYAGAIMVLFLFIIMLLNLKDEELGEAEFKLHHILSGISIVALWYYIVVGALNPLVAEDEMVEAKNQAVERLAEEQKVYDDKLAVLEAAEFDDGLKHDEELAAHKRTKPVLEVAGETAIPGLYGHLSEGALEREHQRKLSLYEEGRATPASGKYARFDPTAKVEVPPVLTGKALKTERGIIRAREPASFGTIEPLSILLVNRFVVPFELTAVLLLAAIVGAVLIAKRRL